MDPRLRTVFDAANAADVRWCLLRGEAHLESPPGDVDLLVAEGDAWYLRRLLVELGYVPLPHRKAHGSHTFYFKYDRTTRAWLKLDIVRELAYGPGFELKTHLQDGCLSRRQRRGDVYVLSDDDAFWTVLLHCLVDKRYVTDRRAAELLSHAGGAVSAGDLGRFVERLTPDDWDGDRIIQLARAEDWPALLRLGDSITEAWRMRSGSSGAVGTSGATSRSGAKDRAKRLLHSYTRLVYVSQWTWVCPRAGSAAIDTLESCGIDGLLVYGSCTPDGRDANILVRGDDLIRLVPKLRQSGFKPWAGEWLRLGGHGVQRINVASGSSWGLSDHDLARLFSAASPIPGRVHVRRASITATRSLSGLPARTDSERSGRIGRLVVDLFGHARRRLTARFGRPSRRALISFSGLDGAGKSYQIQQLRESLERAGEDVSVVWAPFKLWPQSLLNRFPARFRSRLGPERKRPGDEQLRANASRGARRVVVAAWTVIATVAAFLSAMALRRTVAQSPGSILILDRYRLDTTVKLQYWYPDVSKELLVSIIRRLTPAPTVELFLSVSPDVAYARKPEQWNTSQLSRQARLYEALVAYAPAVILNGEGDRDELARHIREVVQVALHG
jgi:thymidylate kinase